MELQDIHYRYGPISRIMKKIHQKLQILFCEHTCIPQCPPNCQLYAPPLTVLQQFIIPHQDPHPLLNTDPNPSTPINPIHCIWNQIKLTLLDEILAYRLITKKVFFDIKHTYHIYLCKWVLNNNTCYKKWQNQSILFHPKNQPSHAHHINNLTTYYTKQQKEHYNKLITKHFNLPQSKDTRYLSPILQLPLITISTQECNLDKNIATNTNVIHLHNQQATSYDNTCIHLITIPKD